MSLLALWISATAAAADLDNDGYPDTIDCDDNDPAIHPGQPERCEIGDQVDDDCNGDVNSADGYAVLTDWVEGTHPELYIDTDRDGFGDDDISALEACELVDGYASNAADCDDSDSTVYPNAEEICDGKDQDCDMLIDEPELDPEDSGCTAVYRDQDGDGYGTLDAEACLCMDGTDTTTNPDDGHAYVRLGGDCADTDATVHPLSCADGVDNDNDGTTDSTDPDCLSGLDERGEAEERAPERLDGADSDCDGTIPAVELDCDGDGSLPLLPLEHHAIDEAIYPEYSGYGSFREAWAAAGVRGAEDLGLTSCTANATATLSCWGQTLTLECDAAAGTGLWVLSYSGEEHAELEGGQRVYSGDPLTTIDGDCDDQCVARYPDAAEQCDGIDSSCSGADPGVDTDGIPDALDAGVAGTIRLAESDADGDGYLDCAAFEDAAEEVVLTGSCTPITDEALLTDCDDSDADRSTDCVEPDVTEESEDGAGCAAGHGPLWLALPGMLLAVLRRR